MVLRTLFALYVALPLFAAAQLSSTLPMDEFKKQLAAKKGLLVDVRTPGECEEGIIDGATLIDYQGREFMTEIGKLDRERPVFLYCAAGGRSRQTMTRMMNMGFKEVHDLEGGMEAWKEAGQPTVRMGSGSKR
jgi:rhodanese-related sulfurtransferase